MFLAYKIMKNNSVIWECTTTISTISKFEEYDVVFLLIDSNNALLTHYTTSVHMLSHKDFITVSFDFNCIK